MGDDQTAILAIVTTNKQQLAGGGVPVFLADDRVQLQSMSETLSNILDASPREIHPDIMVLVKV